MKANKRADKYMKGIFCFYWDFEQIRHERDNVCVNRRREKMFYKLKFRF